MNLIHTRAMTALLAITGYAAIPAEATETLNLSYADAAITGYDNCMPLADLGWMDADPYHQSNVNGCRVEFAVPVPSGHMIRQIAVSHGTYCNDNQPCWDNSILKTIAYVGWNQLAVGGGGSLFYWSSDAPVVPIGSLVSKSLMGKAVAFMIQPNFAYHVVVEVDNASFVAGLQITYD